MDLHNISAKLFIDVDGHFEQDSLIPIFHNWIQDRSVEGMLIDVADYKHVPNGPGIMLIGHECDYAMDHASGRLGFMYRHKRDMSGTLEERLQLIVRRLFQGVQLLRDDARVDVNFKTDVLQWCVFDRLQAPNTEETFSALEPDFRKVGETLWGDDFELQSAHSDPRSLFSIELSGSQELEFSELRNRVL